MTQNSRRIILNSGRDKEGGQQRWICLGKPSTPVEVPASYLNLKNIMGTKKAKKWRSIKVDEETYRLILKNATIREWSISYFISQLLNK